MSTREMAPLQEGTLRNIYYLATEMGPQQFITINLFQSPLPYPQAGVSWRNTRDVMISLSAG